MEEITLDAERTCYNCKNHELCFIRRYFDPAGFQIPSNILGFLKGERFSGNVPAYWQVILVALANSCVEYGQ